MTVQITSPQRRQRADAGLVAAESAAARHLARTTDEDRKSRGQFFTPAPVARFMSSLFENVPESVRLLDAGAGMGALTAAVCDRFADEKGVQQVEIDLFETDPLAVARLTETIESCKGRLSDAGVAMRGTIRVEDFVESVILRERSLFTSPDIPAKYDLAIMNPPYFKLPADSEHARLARIIGPSQPNIYSLFLAAAIDRLVPGGELVAITPRSFCNGLYFKNFRNWLIERADLLRIHAFGSRTETFREAKVLQESIITHYRKRDPSDAPRTSVLISRSFGRDFDDVETEALPVSRIIDTSCGDALISIPESPRDAEIIEIAESWPTRFQDTGLTISTGPVVMFRTREFHSEAPTHDTVPLLTSHHVRGGRVEWPRAKKKWPTSFFDSKASRKHLLPTANYVLVKRFTAKEEHRRLSASAMRGDDFSDERIAIENHLNYIAHAERPLSINEVTGVAALLNSALMDRYFRSFSGNTQVNATEVRTMKFPPLAVIAAIGEELSGDPPTGAGAEEIVMRNLKLSKSVRDYLKGFIR